MFYVLLEEWGLLLSHKKIEITFSLCYLKDYILPEDSLHILCKVFTMSSSSVPKKRITASLLLKKIPNMGDLNKAVEFFRENYDPKNPPKDCWVGNGFKKGSTQEEIWLSLFYYDIARFPQYDIEFFLANGISQNSPTKKNVSQEDGWTTVEKNCGKNGNRKWNGNQRNANQRNGCQRNNNQRKQNTYTQTEKKSDALTPSNAKALVTKETSGTTETKIIKVTVTTVTKTPEVKLMGKSWADVSDDDE